MGLLFRPDLGRVHHVLAVLSFRLLLIRVGQRVGLCADEGAQIGSSVGAPKHFSSFAGTPDHLQGCVL